MKFKETFRTIEDRLPALPVEKQIRMKEKELTRLELTALRPVFAHYFIVMLVIVLMNFMVDQFGSCLNNVLLTDVLFSLFNITSRDITDPLYVKAFADYHLAWSAVYVVLSVILPFYKALPDRFGRKPLLWINTFFMGLGMFIMMRARSVAGYIAGFMFVSFFFEGDVHQIYLLEEAPAKWRTTIVTLCKGFGVLGATMIGIFRRIFVTEANLTDGWRLVLVVPVLFALVTVILSVLLLKDTSLYMKSRTEVLKSQLSKLYAARDAGFEKLPAGYEAPADTGNASETADESAKREKGGVFRTAWFILKHRQTRFIFITELFFFASMIYASIYSTALNSGTLTNDDISNVAIVYPLVEGAFAVLSGFLADRLGRKPSFFIMAFLSLAGFIGWIFSIRAGLNGICVGVIYGVLTGGYWAGRSLLQTNIMAESVPTEIRATVVSISTTFAGALYSLVSFTLSQLVRVIPDIMALYFTVYTVMMAAALVIGGIGIRETKGIDLDTIRGDEWDR